MGKRYELTITTSYVPNWGQAEVLREILQNGRDAEIEFGATMTVEHVYRTRDKRPIGAVVITNQGTTMNKEVLLLGHTSKAQRSDLIGCYGEGLKIATMAALRLNLQIKIKNGSESWVPTIARSEKFDADVLVFDISGGNKFENRVSIEILGIEADEWEKIRKNFLFLCPPAAVVETYEGKVLLDPNLKGQLFVKGMFVCNDPKLNFGYDINTADIDRDRRMISDKYSATSRLLQAAMATGKLTDKVYELLCEGASEVDGIFGSWVEGESRKKLTDKFLSQYGADSIPVETEGEATELGHFGKRGVKVPYNLRSILEVTLGSSRENLRALRMNAQRVYEPSELEENEQANLEVAVRLLRKALIALEMDVDVCEKIRVVEFGDSCLKGTYDGADGGVRLARSVLATAASALRTLIHEAGHMAGVDGSKQHETAMGNLTEAVLGQLL